MPIESKNFLPKMPKKSALTVVVVAEPVFQDFASCSKTPSHFRNLFESRLQSIKSFSELSTKADPIPSEEGDIEVKREAYGGVFRTKPQGDFEVWIVAPKNIEKGFEEAPHYDTEQQLQRYLMGNRLLRPFGNVYHCTILEDYDGNLYLAIDREQVEYAIKNHIEIPEEKLKWSEMLKAYGIKKMIGPPTLKKMGFNREDIIEGDIIVDSRETRFLALIARNYNMNAPQYYRFRSLVIASKEANLPLNAFDLAKEIVKLDQETFETG